MNCNDCREWLDALIDGELSSEQTALIESHLKSCAECASELAALRRVDSQLSALQLPKPKFTAANLVAASTNAVPLKESNPKSAPSLPRATFWFAALAAMLLVALGVWQFSNRFLPSNNSNPIVEHDDGEANSSPTHLATLVRATGEVEILRKDESQWIKFASFSSPIGGGDRIRTPSSVTCELETSEKVKLRLNQQSEVRFVESNRIECLTGQVWCQTSNDEMQFDLDTSDENSRHLISVRCTGDSEIQWSILGNLTSCVATGSTQTVLNWNSELYSIGPGGSVSVSKQGFQELTPPNRLDQTTTKLWQLPLLSLGNTDESELADLLEPALAFLGETKVSYMVESQIRALGARGAPPLFAYVESDRSQSSPGDRHKAMRLACELADGASIERLKRLVNDRDRTIADAARSALNRLQIN